MTQSLGSRRPLATPSSSVAFSPTVTSVHTVVDAPALIGSYGTVASGIAGLSAPCRRCCTRRSCDPRRVGGVVGAELGRRELRRARSNVCGASQVVVEGRVTPRRSRQADCCRSLLRARAVVGDADEDLERFCAAEGTRPAVRRTGPASLELRDMDPASVYERRAIDTTCCGCRCPCCGERSAADVHERRVRGARCGTRGVAQRRTDADRTKFVAASC